MLWNAVCMKNVFQLYNAVVIGYIIPLTQDGATLLYVASEKGHSDIVNILIRNGADINLTFEV